MIIQEQLFTLKNSLLNIISC